MITGQRGRDKRVPVRLTIEGWPKLLQRGKLGKLFVHDPMAVANPEADWESFTRAMFHFNLGGTAKITWPGRQAETDQLLVVNVDTTNARIVELGASDGTPAIDLIKLLGDRFASYVITDRFIRVTVTHFAGWRWIWRDGPCVVAGNGRFVIWPLQSQVLTRMISSILRAAARRQHHEVVLLNPNTRMIIDRDSRVSWAEHDVFEPLAEPVEVIKVGNLLRRVYFTDDQIMIALRAIHGSLVDGGHLLIADHLKVAAGGLYRRTPTGFAKIAATSAASEIDDLLATFAVADEPVGMPDSVDHRER